MKTNNTTDYASMYANLSKACLFTGNCEEAQKFLNCALTALESSKSSQLRNSMQQNRENESRKKNNEDGLKDNKRSRAIDLFLRHRRAEIESEVESISHCLSALKSLHSLPLKCSQAQALKMGFLHTLSRVLHFGFNGFGDYDDSSYPVDNTLGIVPITSASSTTLLDGEMTPARALILAVKDKFGLDRVHEVAQPSMNTSDTLRADQLLSNKSTDLIMEECKREVTAKLSRSLVSDSGFIDFNELFRTVKSCSKSTASSAMDIASDEQEEEEDADEDEVVVDSLTNRLPVNMEICSGSGEWVVSHAASDLYHRSNKHDKRDKSAAAPPGLNPRALWLALELRCDRVYHTICRSVLENLVRHSQHVRESSVMDSAHAQSSPPEPLILGGLLNLAVIGGDASHILPNRIAPGSIANVYINHPEPPERTGGVGDSEGQHLLTQSFFTEIHRILSKEGKCTIVTDNLPYAKSLLQALGKTSVCAKKSSSRKKVYFTSMILPDTADGDLKSRVLEEEIVISTTQSLDTIGNERKKDVIQEAKIKMKRTDSDDSSEEDGGDEEDNVGYEDDYTYVNDEDVVPLNGNIKSVNNKLKQNAQSNNKNAPRETMKKSKMTQNVKKAKAYDGRESQAQLLQLWRGDSAEVDDTDGNGEDRASSYFDRMWERGQKKRRYFMVLKKG